MIQQIRMKKRKMFLNVAENGFRIVSGSIVVQSLPNQMSVLRTGFTTTKKIGCAVVRNRTRRRLRELVRTCPKMDEMRGFDLVFVGRISTKDRPYEKLKADLILALTEILHHYTQKETS